MRLSWYNRLLDLKGDHRMLVRLLAEQVEVSTKTILDVGAGSGLLDHHLLAYSDAITLLEPSSSMLSHVTHPFEILRYGLEELQTKRQWEVVIAKGTVHHFANGFSDKQKVVEEQLWRMYALASRTLVIIEPDMSTLSGRWLRFLENKLLRLGSCFYTEKDYRDLFAADAVSCFKTRGYIMMVVQKHGK